MANPPATTFVCLPPRTDPNLKITFPGIEQLQAFKTTLDRMPSAGAEAMMLLGQVSPALSPIVAILRMVDVIFDVIQALQDVTDPFALAKDIEKLVADSGLLADFIPGLPYVKMLRDLLSMIESILRGLATAITRWVNESAAIGKALSSARLLGDPDLTNSAQCAAQRLLEAQATTQVSLQDVGQLLKIVKLIADIINAVVPVSLPGISDLTDALDTLATSMVSGPGTIGSSSEAARMLSLAGELTSFANAIHNLYILLVDIVGY
jgi:hypothetical protein